MNQKCQLLVPVAEANFRTAVQQKGKAIRRILGNFEKTIRGVSAESRQLIAMGARGTAAKALAATSKKGYLVPKFSPEEPLLVLNFWNQGKKVRLAVPISASEEQDLNILQEKAGAVVGVYRSVYFEDATAMGCPADVHQIQVAGISTSVSKHLVKDGGSTPHSSHQGTASGAKK